MSNFPHIMQTVITGYKSIMRKQLPAKECSAKLRSLGLKRKQLKDIDEVALYHIAENILHDLENHVVKNDRASWYSGIDEFHQYVSNILDEYHITEAHVINSAQSASKALVNAIQLIGLPTNQASSANMQKIEKNCHDIAKYGSLEQIDMFIRALNKQKTAFSQMILRKFDNYLEKFSKFSSFA